MANDKIKYQKEPGVKRTEGEKAEQRRYRREGRGLGESADWSTASAALLVRVIANCSRAGCAIQFGYTRDGNAYRVRIVGDGPEAYDEYCRPPEDLELFLEGIAVAFE